ncbi:uncharacterized protein LOC129292037 [Prosopis cineraria]|uniref:uncharacterized protein LOC129292037 n=1 Tax=Prosopis cineraria TaxID=364024 RepID=UPI00240EAE87|nr:uncharacterized protein LOC129292037 [Prosopis cineraria]
MEAAAKSASAKQLKEHLQHQQEPFSLHNYLSERRFFIKNFSSDDIDDHHHLPSEKTLKWRITYEKHKIKERFFHASSILRSLLHKFVPFGDHHHHQNQKLSNWVGINNNAASDDRFTNQDAEGEGFICHDYSPKLVNMFPSFTLPELRRLQMDSGAKPHWISTVEKQWEQSLANSECEFKSDEGAAGTAIYTLSQKSEEPFFSTHLPKLLLNPNILKFRRPKKDKHHNVVHRRKRTQQVLFGRAEKGREFQENGGKRGKIWLLEKRCRDREAQKIAHLLNAESCVVSEGWTNFHRPSRDIHFEIGDAIMDDIVNEMLHILVH